MTTSRGLQMKGSETWSVPIDAFCKIRLHGVISCKLSIVIQRLVFTAVKATRDNVNLCAILTKEALKHIFLKLLIPKSLNLLHAWNLEMGWHFHFHLQVANALLTISLFNKPQADRLDLDQVHRQKN